MVTSTIRYGCQYHQREMTSVKKGSRVQVDGYRGTVRYIGELEGSSGEWIGIEWDQPDRGKHHGKYLGKEYFRCLPMTSASFIRLSSRIRLGREFMEVIREQYGHLDSQNLEKIRRMNVNSWWRCEVSKKLK